MDSITIRKPNDKDLADAARLLAILNPDASQALVRQRLDAILADHPHYHLVGAFAGDKLVGVCGAWIASKIWCGRYLEIDNIVVDPDHRSKGIGSLLIQHFESLGRERECTLLVLDSYAANRPSHRLYHRLGFEIWGFHFVKPTGDWSGQGAP